jgi:GMP synthase PP-ATPase subunit
LVEEVKMFEPEKFIQKQVQEVRERIGAGKAVIAVSGVQVALTLPFVQCSHIVR